VIRTQGSFEAMAALVFGALLCASCQDGYPIAASQCDEWCDAAEPTFCGNYDPAGCVLECSQSGGDAPECHAELVALVTLLRGLTEQQLACANQFRDGQPPPWNNAQQAYARCSALHSARQFFGPMGGGEEPTPSPLGDAGP
jgi:hypothetical protein